VTRDRLLFYCQHSLGLGHLARSLRLADGLTERFDVRLLNGGRFPAGTTVPAGVDVLNLPPLGHDADGMLVSHDPAYTVERARARRTELLLAALDEDRPAVVLIEMYPFGRRKFEFELVPLLDAVAALGADRPRVVCSLRDILVRGVWMEYQYGFTVHNEGTAARIHLVQPGDEIPMCRTNRSTGCRCAPWDRRSSPAGRCGSRRRDRSRFRHHRR